MNLELAIAAVAMIAIRYGRELTVMQTLCLYQTEHIWAMGSYMHIHGLDARVLAHSYLIAEEIVITQVSDLDFKPFEHTL